MAKNDLFWAFSPPKHAHAKIPKAAKEAITIKANALVESVLKPMYIGPPPPDMIVNYIVDIFTKWHRCYLYFCSTYRCPHPQAATPSFESRFARVEYASDQKFYLSFRRYTGEWVELYSDISLEACFTAIKEESYFHA